MEVMTSYSYKLILFLLLVKQLFHVIIMVVILNKITLIYPIFMIIILIITYMH